jgi:hypothetical protein
MSITSKLPFIRIEVVNDLRIIYYREDGSSAIYLGGQRNWRNNNPGNIGYGNGILVKRLGAIGKAGGFAVFPDYETGRTAIFGVLKQDSFQNRIVSKAIEVWAPKEDGNDTELYKKHIRLWTGIELSRQIKTLSNEELEKLVAAIEKKEGSESGKIIEVPTSGVKKKIIDIKKNKQNLIIQYLVEGYGWLHKADTIYLVERDIVDGVVVKNSRGYIFLRARPDDIIINNLDKTKKPRK